MFNNPFQTNNLQELQSKLELMKQQQFQSSLNPNQRLGGSFGKLQDFIQNTDKAKVNFANSDSQVIEKYNSMRDVFILYMLESSRPQFEHWCKERNINVIDSYVEAFIQKTNEYVEPSVKQDTEIESLKKQILELQNMSLHPKCR